MKVGRTPTLTAAQRTSLAERRARGVDAVAGLDQRLVGHEVRGREAELAAASVAGDDLAAHRERRAEEARRDVDLAGQHEPADVRGGDDLALDLDERHDARLEARRRRRSSSRVALRAVAEAEVLADRDARRLQRLDEHVVDEVLGAALRERSSNGITTSSSTPSSATSSALRSSVVSSFGAASGRTTASGCGSNVRTVSLPSITARWPRWTPSNSPTATRARARLDVRAAR